MATDQGIAQPGIFQLPINGHRDRRRVIVGYTLVNDDAFTHEVLAKHRWNAHTHGYVTLARVSADGKRQTLLLHRVVYEHYFGPIPAGLEIDHIDRNKMNNTASNLRAVTKSANSANIGRRKNNTSGYHGVVWFARTRKWVAQIKYNKRGFNLGYFNTAREAADAVNRAYQKYYPDVQIPNP